MPFGDVWIHSPDSKCTLAEMIGVTIEIVSKDYEKALGCPTEDYNAQIVYLTTEPKSLLRKALNALKQTISRIKQQRLSQNHT